MTETIANIQYSAVEPKCSAFLSHSIYVSRQENKFKALIVQP